MVYESTEKKLKNLAEEAGIETIPPIDAYEKTGEILRRDNDTECFINEEGVDKLVIKLNWIETKELHFLVLKEAVIHGQRIEAYKVCYNDKGYMKECYSGTTIGYKRKIELGTIMTDCLIIVIEKSYISPAMAFVGVY